MEILPQMATPLARVATARVRTRVRSRVARGRLSLARGVARAASDVVDVRFRIHARVEFGDELVAVGNARALGAWRVDRGVRLRWTDGDVWVGEAAVSMEEARGGGLAFKCARRGGGGGDEWEDGDDKTIAMDALERARAVDASWSFGDATCDVVVVEGDVENGDAVDAVDADADAARAVADEEDSMATSTWNGDEIRMMQSNEHTKDRPLHARWDVSALEESSSAREIVLRDKDGGSWFEKLCAVANEIGIGKEITRDRLAASATYLRWISTGTIKCVESGGHRRPNGPAMVGRGIFISMEQIQGAMYRHGTDLGEVERVLMRHVHPWLPSFNEEFINAVPLTRIRDIAHRGDIPEDLKRTIKHTIQNKLHRNAGPEDLVATEIVLKQITRKKGEYSDDFVREFKEFHKELKRFFNASGVFERLASLKGTLDEETEPLIDDLFRARDRLNETNDGWYGEEGDALRRALDVCTELRSYFCAGLSTGMRNDAPDDSVCQRQAWRQVELSLEEYAFVLLARCNNIMEEGRAMEVKDANAFKHAASVSAIALKHIGLSGWRSLEAGIIARELIAWTNADIGRDQDTDRRLKATLQRAKRLIESQTHAVMSGFGDAPVQLANSFGLDGHVGATFVESIIRAGVPFQLSRIVEKLSEAVERDLDGDGFDPIVLGNARGELVRLERLTPESVQKCGEKDIIAFVESIDGDEEISSAGSNVKGVILRDEVAHLSHLAIRARQEGTPLVSALSWNARDRVNARVGKDTVMSVGACSTEVRDFDGTRDSVDNDGRVSHAAVAPTPCELVDSIQYLTLDRATTSNAGAKSSVCANLLRIANVSGTFTAPGGFVLPFGCMESSVRDVGEFQRLLAVLEDVSLEDIDDACASIRAFITESLPAQSVIEEACATLNPDVRLAIRSSANVEDLSGMSAAGLYESVVGVDARDVDAVQRAVSDVWASLYSRRAVLARRAAGVKQTEARMAVLAQELSPNTLSFVLHTRSPIRGARCVQAEVCVGLGETLANGVDGTPWRLEIDRTSGDVTATAYANHGTAFRCRYGAPTFGKVTVEAVDYTRQELSTDASARARLGERLLNLATELESTLGCAQDVEGGFRGDELIIVQSRPQPMQ